MNCQELRHPSCRNLKFCVPKSTWGYLKNLRTELVAFPVIFLYMRKVTQIFNYKTCIFAWARISWKGEGQDAATLHRPPSFPAASAACWISPAYRSAKPFPALLAGEIAVLLWSSWGPCHNLLFQLLTQLGAQKQNGACPLPLSFGTVHVCTHSLTCRHTNPSISILPKILFTEERQG